jgi:hypothetical protein
MQQEGKLGRQPELTGGGLIRGDDGGDVARQVCANILSASERDYISFHDRSHIFKAIFEMQPFIALDSFLLPQPSQSNRHLFDADFGMGTPLEVMDSMILLQWADLDPGERFSLPGQFLSMFGRKNDGDEIGLSPLFLSILDYVPDKRSFLDNYRHRLYPQSWSGSLSDILMRRKSALMQLAEHSDENVKGWVAETMPELERWIENERGCDREREESFA